VSGQRGLRARVDTTVAAIAGITVVGFALRLAVLFRPIGVIDKLFIPDDTYYTLTIARSLAHGHGPTVDGHTLTSGFQALLGFLLVPVFWVTDNPDTALRLDLVLLVVVDTLTIVVLAWVAYRFAGRVAAVAAAALWAISPVAVSMALGGLETSLAILSGIGLVAVWMWANDLDSDDRRATRRWIVVGVIAGLAVLARIDTLLLVALLGGVQLWRGPRRPLVPGAIAGAVVLAPWWIWCTVTFGTPIPTSGSAAHDLAPLRPFAGEGLAQVAGAVVGGPFDVWRSLREWMNDHPVAGIVGFWVLVLGLLFVAVWWSRRRVLPQLAVATLPAFAAGLLVFYAWFGVGWYFTRYLAPVALVVTLMIAVAVARVWRARGKWRVPAFAATVIVLAIGVVAALRADTHHLTATDAPELSFDSVTGYRDAARLAVAVPPAGSVLGAWQSGAFGYYANDRITVVNLDGVVNPAAADAARADRTAFYIRDRSIGWLADFDLHLVWFAFGGSQQLDPRPTLTTTKLPQFPPFPGYGVGRINWPPGSGVRSR
jgi:Dolichyl-phosphate-mannose-protein mannosyltransferase